MLFTFQKTGGTVYKITSTCILPRKRISEDTTHFRLTPMTVDGITTLVCTKVKICLLYLLDLFIIRCYLKFHLECLECNSVLQTDVCDLCHVTCREEEHAQTKDHKRIFYCNELLERVIPETIASGHKELQAPHDTYCDTARELKT